MTELTRALGIRGEMVELVGNQSFASNGMIVPVVQGGMQWVGYAEMASAVSNAGGLGIVRTRLLFIFWTISSNTNKSSQV